MEFETETSNFFERFIINDINLLFTISFMIAAREIENQPYHYWPEFGFDMIGDLRDNRFYKVQKDMIDNIMPFTTFGHQSSLTY